MNQQDIPLQGYSHQVNDYQSQQQPGTYYTASNFGYTYPANDYQGQQESGTDYPAGGSGYPSSDMPNAFRSADSSETAIPVGNQQLYYNQSSAVEDDNLQNLARRMSWRAQAAECQRHAFRPEPGSHLDPNSPSFEPRAWIKAFLNLLESDDAAAPRRLLGVAFQNLSVFGWSSGAAVQRTVLNRITHMLSLPSRLISRGRQGQRVEILRDFEGVVGEGELLLVLGPPGSGCSTLLKTLAGQTAGLKVSKEAYINFRGVDLDRIRGTFRGDIIYNAEADNHIPHLTVGETLLFAARARSARYVPAGLTRIEADTMMRDVMMATFGISHTIDTWVGSDVIRGVSGGERKRVSIAEAALTGAKFQCWDNSTRGLDSGNATNFCRNLRLQADLMGISAAVAIYQAPQSAYDLFDRVTVLYEGRQIFFGRTDEARQYFEELGFECPERQTTPDFLTSMTSPSERYARLGFEHRVPRTPDEFAARWRESRHHWTLTNELAGYEHQHPRDERLAEFKASRRAEQAEMQRARSAYTISYWQQVQLTVWRAWRRLLANPGVTIGNYVYNVIIGLVLGSMFYDMKGDSSSFYYRGAIVFFALLTNAFSSLMEVLAVYEERPIVEKQNRYAFYHQSAQAIASYVIELPYKTVGNITFNLLIYFMANLRREPGSFFFFCLATYLTTLVMSLIFRILACVTRTVFQAFVPAALISHGFMIYVGFALPTTQMPDWSRWMAYINPLGYAFEALMANEFHGREFPCATMIPQGDGYGDVSVETQVCSVVGAVAGTNMVGGDAYIELSFAYYNANKWRNIGVLFAFMAGLAVVYLFAAEGAKPPKSNGEVLVFPKRKVPRASERLAVDNEAQPSHRFSREEQKSDSNLMQGFATETAVFHWENICYDIKIKKEERRILDHVDGWVKPGATTALMGVSGAGKTTLLDVLATRVTMGVVSGDALINGSSTDASFQHRVGYVQQQDLHLETMTIREALEFSALLRQSEEIPKQKKLAYVDEVISMLEMEAFADAVIGVPGEGLNVEQRKRLTIGVELAARPQLLLFLDEPTSGLDSQTSWSICQLIKKLTRSGQAILCTIHQPSAMLFGQFDHLLLLAPGGKTVYFGELGKNSRTLIDYFERNGAKGCPANANPAEWMLDVIKTSGDGSNSIDWHQTWKKSYEYEQVKNELARLRGLSTGTTFGADVEQDSSQHREFVTSFRTQFCQLLKRTWKHFWRSPTYIWSKTVLIILTSLYIGFSFSASSSIQGLINQLYAIFMFFILFGTLNQQIMPMFLPQRSLFEVREGPSKIYKWTTYITANIIVEAFWNSMMAVIMFFCWYYPIGFVRNTTDEDRAARGFLIFLFWWTFMLFTSTFSHLSITWIENAEMGGGFANTLWLFCLSFCGVGVAYADLPKFWTFMYRLSPGTYLASGLLSSAVANTNVVCADHELLHLEPPSGMGCEEYLERYINDAGINLLNPEATSECIVCPMISTNQFMASFNIDYANRWWHFGIMWVFIVVNVVAALGMYWLVRVPRNKGSRNKHNKEA